MLTFPTSAGEPPLSPTALAAAKDGRVLWVACATANRVLRFDLKDKRVTGMVAVPARPSGLALSRDGTLLYVTCAAPESRLCVVDTTRSKVVESVPAGHTAMAPIVSPDGKQLFVCSRFDNEVTVFAIVDSTRLKPLRHVPVQREPVAADITPDGRVLLVANHLHNGPAEAEVVAAQVTALDVSAGNSLKTLTLPDGAGLLNDIRISPDGKYAVVSHVLSRFRLPATQLDRGWMNDNAVTIIDVAKLEIVNTVLLDNVDRGAANPWGVAWSADSRALVIAHAGTHEVSLIDFPALLAKLSRIPATADGKPPADPNSASRVQADVPTDLAFLVGVRERIKLPASDLGPRAVVCVGRSAWVGNYFSDSLTVLEIAAPAKPESFSLGPKAEPSLVRKGEFYFHDAGICFQGWQSCATCHPGDARVDGLNWDLLNDGIGNPKNTKSLLWSHRTPPAMSTGVRETAETAVRAGIRHILFTVQPEEVPVAIDAYLKSLQPVPSPHLVKGKLSPAAKRGEKLFNDRRVGCASCHPPGLFTDLQSYDVGTRSAYEQGNEPFDTPTLVELWRTAPYLHDGSAATLEDVLRARNPGDQHGHTKALSREQLNDLVAYLLSL